VDEEPVDGGPAEEPVAEEPVAEEPVADEPLESFYGRDDIFGLKLPPAATPTPPKVPPKRARTATGALLTGIALGLRDVFDPEKKNDTIAIEQEAPAEPEGPQRYEIHLKASPRDSQAIYRPWVGDGPEVGDNTAE
jgi:hypothetical protein